MILQKMYINKEEIIIKGVFMADTRTKQMLLDEIEQLKTELNIVENKRKMEEPIAMIRGMYEGLVASGFTDEQAFQLTRDMTITGMKR